MCFNKLVDILISVLVICNKNFLDVFNLKIVKESTYKIGSFFYEGNWYLVIENFICFWNNLWLNKWCWHIVFLPKIILRLTIFYRHNINKMINKLGTDCRITGLVFEYLITTKKKDIDFMAARMDIWQVVTDLLFYDVCLVIISVERVKIL